MVKDTQNNLYYLIISFSKENKSTQVTAKNEIDASCKRKPLHGTLAFERFSFSQNVRWHDQKTRFTLTDFHCNLKYQNCDLSF